MKKPYLTNSDEIQEYIKDLKRIPVLTHDRQEEIFTELLSKSTTKQRKKELYSEGLLIPWNKGLTKYDDPRVAAMSAGIKENYSENADASFRRLSPEQFRERVESINTFSLISDPASYKNKYQKIEVKCRNCGIHQFKNFIINFFLLRSIFINLVTSNHFLI
mgnify:CR=1 FL=1